MKVEELLAAWPNVRVAVAYTEAIICTAPGDGHPVSSWELMVKGGLTPDEMLAAIQEVTDEEAAESGNCRSAEAAAQMRHPDYRKYLAGKLGLL